MQINKNAEKLIRQLNNQGYEAFIVGGCVRDYLLGLTPHDTDICTNALPEQTKNALRLIILLIQVSNTAQFPLYAAVKSMKSQPTVLTVIIPITVIRTA